MCKVGLGRVVGAYIKCLQRGRCVKSIKTMEKMFFGIYGVGKRV